MKHFGTHLGVYRCKLRSLQGAGPAKLLNVFGYLFVMIPFISFDSIRFERAERLATASWSKSPGTAM